MKRILAVVAGGLCSSVFAWTLVSPQIDGWSPRTLTIYVNPTNCTMTESQVYDEVDRAIAIWNQVPSSRLTLVRSPTASTVTPDEFEAGSATQLPVVFCEPDFENAIGSADAVPAATQLSNLGAGPLTSAAIYLNAEVGTGAEITQLEPEEFRIALTHEMGHMLGLGHSASTGSLMYFSITGKTTARLTEDDRMGITYLYPRNELAAGTFGCSAVHGSGTPWSLLGALAYLLSLWGLGRRWIRSERLPSLPG